MVSLENISIINNNQNTITLRYSVLIVSIFFSIQQSFAQFKEVHIRRNTIENSKSKQTKTLIGQLKLPFFDDFSSTSNGRPDTRNWEENSGVFINNSFSNTHPSINMATFDGQNANFLKYAIDSTTLLGITDVLTSREIDLSSYKASDKVMLSFFYQNGGLGEIPDLALDSLVIQFKEENGKWSIPVSLDNKKAILQADTNLVTRFNFKQFFIPISIQNYLHNKFKFRFVAYGNREGGFDVWNIDYVYLNKNRIDKVPYITKDFTEGNGDQCVRQVKKGIFNDYQAVPMRQLKRNAKFFLSDSISLDFTNMTLSQINIFDVDFRVKDKLTGQNIITQVNTQFPNEKSGVVGNNLKFPNKIAPSSFSKLGQKALLNLYYGIKKDNSTDNENELVPGVLEVNDTTSVSTVIDDYYAYDDGTPESGIFVNKGFARLAVKFSVGSKDTLQALDINFQNIDVKQANQRFFVTLFDEKNGKIGESIFQSDTSFLVKFPEKYNGFVRYPLLKKNSNGTYKGVPVDSVFYVSFTQIADNEALVFGLDKNNDKSSRVYYDLSRGWSQSAIKGSLMVRAVSGGVLDVITGIEEDQIKKSFKLYPNPSNGIFNWNNNAFKEAMLYTMDGQLILNKKLSKPSLDLSAYPKGNYILILGGMKTTITNKIIIK